MIYKNANHTSTLGYVYKNLKKIYGLVFGFLFFVISISGGLGGGAIQYVRYDGHENGEKEEEPGQAENPEISRV
jgi:hypothetical protein